MIFTQHPLQTDLSLRTLLVGIDWRHGSVVVYGKTHPQPRLTCWYGDVPYAYSGLCWDARPMPPWLLSVRQEVEALAGQEFNSVLCNLYRDGQDCVGWHADDEALFGGDPVVASVSFGASRLFKLRRKDRSEAHDVTLHDRSVFIMGRGVQQAWQHSLPRTKKPIGQRINLTFRQTV